VQVVPGLLAPLQERAPVAAVVLPLRQHPWPACFANLWFADRLSSTSSLRLPSWPWRCPFKLLAG